MKATGNSLISIGVIGCGYWGSKHVRVLSQRSDSQCLVIEPRDEVRERVAAMNGIPPHHRFASLDDALPYCDALLIATPAAEHFALAQKGLEAGKHLLIEKPMTLNSAEADALVAMADERGLLVAVGHTYLYHPAVLKLKELIDLGVLGKIRFIDSRRVNLGPIRDDTDALADLAAHDISIANFLLDSTPDCVQAWSDAFLRPHIADSATLRLNYGEVVVTVRVSWLEPVKLRSTTIVGDKMMATFDEGNSHEPLTIYDRGELAMPAEFGCDYSVRDGGVSVAPSLDAVEPLAAEIDDFVRGITTKAGFRSSARFGAGVVKVIEAAHTDARNRLLERPLRELDRTPLVP